MTNGASSWALHLKVNNIALAKRILLRWDCIFGTYCMEQRIS